MLDPHCMQKSFGGGFGDMLERFWEGLFRGLGMRLGHVWKLLGTMMRCAQPVVQTLVGGNIITTSLCYIVLVVMICYIFFMNSFVGGEGDAKYRVWRCENSPRSPSESTAGRRCDQPTTPEIRLRPTRDDQSN